MGAGGWVTDDAGVLAPSWPVPDRVSRRLTSPQVRRRVEAAQRRAMRRAVVGGGSLILGAVALDALNSTLWLGDIGRQMALYQVLELIVVGTAVAVAARGMRIAELAALPILVFSFGMSLVRLWMLPETAVLSVTYATVTVVGSGLMLPWASRWHGAWLTVAGALTLVAALALPGLSASIGGGELLVAAVALAALVSFFGHRMWQVRLGSMLEHQFVLRELSRYARRQEAHVTTLNLELNRVARRDALTGVGNRRALDEALGRLLDRGDRLRPQAFAIALFDIDHFKDYNDEHGHLVGDAALEHLGSTLRHAVRESDLAFRYGGEEFLLIVPGADLPAALAVADRVREVIAADVEPGLPPLTVSGGVAVFDPAEGADPAPLLRRADDALYEAKRGGRNRVAADALSRAIRRAELRRDEPSEILAAAG